MEEFKLKLSDALSDDAIIERYQKIFENASKPVQRPSQNYKK